MIVVHPRIQRHPVVCVTFNRNTKQLQRVVGIVISIGVRNYKYIFRLNPIMEKIVQEGGGETMHVPRQDDLSKSATSTQQEVPIEEID